MNNHKLVDTSKNSRYDLGRHTTLHPIVTRPSSLPTCQGIPGEYLCNKNPQCSIAGEPSSSCTETDKLLCQDHGPGYYLNSYCQCVSGPTPTPNPKPGPYGGQKSNMPTPAKVGIGFGVVIGIALLIFLILKLTKRSAPAYYYF